MKTLKLEIKVYDSTYDKLLSRSYLGSPKVSVAGLISEIVEVWALREAEAEMSTIELELEEGVMEWLVKQSDSENLTLDEVIMNAMIKQLGVSSEGGEDETK